VTSQPRQFVAYLRVSTARQGQSGLGLEAQEAAIQAYLAQTPGARLLAPPHVEIESGRKADRPELAKALERCRKTGAALLIAKLDRLARDAHFLLGLQKAGVEFVAADLPRADRLTVGILAMVAEEEAKRTSARTKAALAAAKARGTRLGGVRQGQRPPTPEEALAGSARGVEARRVAAGQAAHRVAPRIAELQGQGYSLAQVAKALTAEGYRTPRGAEWTATAVRRAALRAGE
jgi:DNA invertase Pin-like site-specific DNA recombinase